jgi:hypothetical protein
VFNIFVSFVTFCSKQWFGLYNREGREGREDEAAAPPV